MSLILEIDDNLYDVHNFIEKHPGEGIRNVYLTHYKWKKVSAEFDKFHTTNESMQMLLDAQDKGSFEGIVYLGKNPFSHKRRIFRQFRYFGLDDDVVDDNDDDVVDDDVAPNIISQLNQKAEHFLRSEEGVRNKGFVAYTQQGHSADQILTTRCTDTEATHYVCVKDDVANTWSVVDCAERFGSFEKLEDLLANVDSE